MDIRCESSFIDKKFDDNCDDGRTCETLINRVFTLATEALNDGEVPVGCVLALENFQGKLSSVVIGEDKNENIEGKLSLVIGEGKNETNATKNPTRHAELVAVDRALDWCKENGFEKNYMQIFQRTILYVNVEPCVMCAGALAQLNLHKIVFGCRNERFGGFGSVLNVPESLNYHPIVVEGVRKEEAVNLLKLFYTGENPNAPKGKQKRKPGRKPVDSSSNFSTVEESSLN